MTTWLQGMFSCLAAAIAPELCLHFSPSCKAEGAGDAGCPMHPQTAPRS